MGADPVELEQSPINLCGAKDLRMDPGICLTFRYASFDGTSPVESSLRAQSTVKYGANAGAYNNSVKLVFDERQSDARTRLQLQACGLPARIGRQAAGQPQITWRLAQVDFRWGRSGKEDEGSEHFIEGRQHALELQFLHYNDRYPNLTAALNATNTSDAVLVVAQLYALDPDPTKAANASLVNDVPGMQKVVSALKMMQSKPVSDQQENPTWADETNLTLSGADLTSLIDIDYNDGYYSYAGSLSSPSCAGMAVTWVVMAKVKSISSEAVAAFKMVINKPTYLNHLWEVTDADKSGEIDVAEFASMTAWNFQADSNMTDVTARFDKLDLNKDGKLDKLGEFRAFLATRPLFSAGNMRPLQPRNARTVYHIGVKTVGCTATSAREAEWVHGCPKATIPETEETSFIEYICGQSRCDGLAGAMALALVLALATTCLFERFRDGIWNAMCTGAQSVRSAIWTVVTALNFCLSGESCTAYDASRTASIKGGEKSAIAQSEQIVALENSGYSQISSSTGIMKDVSLIRNEKGGVGITFVRAERNDIYTVSGMSPAGPAATSDAVKVGDDIIRVDGIPIRLLSAPEVSAKIVGKPFSQVVLSILEARYKDTDSSTHWEERAKQEQLAVLSKIELLASPGKKGHA